MNINTRFSAGQRVHNDSAGDGFVERLTVDVVGTKQPLITYEVRLDSGGKQLFFDSDLELINCNHHELKCWPEYFREVFAGIKTFEVRKNDRSFKAGDILFLREWSPVTQEYSGVSVRRLVTYTLTGHDFGIREGFIVMGIEPI